MPAEECSTEECGGLWEVVGMLRLLPTPSNSHPIILLGISKAFGLVLYLKCAKAIESPMATETVPSATPRDLSGSYWILELAKHLTTYQKSKGGACSKVGHIEDYCK